MLVLTQRVTVTIVPLQESSGANIKLAKESSKIRVHGNAVQMAAAVPKVEQLIKDFGGEPIVIPVAEGEAVVFIGKRTGDPLRKLQDETGAYIDFAKDESCVKIRGKPADAEKAKKAIDALLDAERNAVDIEVRTRVELTLDPLSTKCCTCSTRGRTRGAACRWRGRRGDGATRPTHSWQWFVALACVVRECRCGVE